MYFISNKTDLEKRGEDACKYTDFKKGQNYINTAAIKKVL